MKRTLTFLWLTLSLYGYVYSQSCGAGDTIMISANSNTEITLDIDNYFNNDLSNPGQALCGIEFHFVHQLSEHLEVSLSSPAGQTIELIGPNTENPAAFTFGTSWNIFFTPCAETPMPDLGYLAQWNNDQPNNFLIGGSYTGSYHPFNGCLEDFNTGPVNGTWTFSINNDPSFYIGAVVYARLIFCDVRGVPCCFADGGDLMDVEPMLVCLGDTSLADLDPGVEYVAYSPDSLEYGYTWLIAEGQDVLEITDPVDLSGYGEGTYQVCGVSYRLSDYDYILNIPGNWQLDPLNDTLSGLLPPFCAAISDTCLTVQIVAPPPLTHLLDTICAGEQSIVSDSIFTESGSYIVPLESYAGCDSIVALNLWVHPTLYTDIETTICQGESIEIGMISYMTTGVFEDTLSSLLTGCDSIVRLDLEVLQPITVDTTFTICNGDSIQVGQNYYSVAGNYSEILMASFGCDSTVNFELEVLSIQLQNAEPDTITCATPNVLLDASSSIASLAINYQWYLPDGSTASNSANMSTSVSGWHVLEGAIVQNGLVCVDTDSVFVYENTIYPNADAGMTDTLNCDVNEIMIGGAGTSVGPGIVYEWTTQLGTFSGATNTPFANVIGAGNYQLIVEDTINGCADTSFIEIQVDTLAPLAQVVNSPVLNCLVEQDTLFSTGSSLGPQYEYLWQGDCVLNNVTDPYAVIDCQGTYRLEITNTLNACIQTSEVFVVKDTFAPEVVIASPEMLSCENNIIDLDGRASSPASRLEYQWEGSGVVGDTTQPLIQINEGGQYSLIVTNTSNFCSDTAFVEIEMDTIHPVSDAGIIQTINCDFQTAEIGGPSTSQGSQYEYLWTTTDGHFISDVNEMSVTVDDGGFYVLHVIDTLNGCIDSSVVAVGLDTLAPLVEAGDNQTLLCGQESVILDGSESDTSFNLTIKWISDCLSMPANDITLETDCPGMYSLEITNIDNGCSSIDSVYLTVDTARVVAVLPDSVAIDCSDGTAVIDASASNQGVYQWWHQDTLTSYSNDMPIVADTGTWSLIVSNLDQSCIDTAYTEVYLDCALEINLITPPDSLVCDVSLTTIGVEVLPIGPDYQYEWIGPSSGCIYNILDDVTVEVVCGGVYQLVATNTLLGISDTLDIEVFEDEERPFADAGLPDTLTCDQHSVFLDGGNSSQGAEYTYIWTNYFTADTIARTQTVDVMEAGSYLLEVFNMNNNCRSVSLVTVSIDTIQPAILFGNDLFGCESDTSTIETAVLPEREYIYQWTGPSIVANADSASVLIDQLGVYNFYVENIVSGCFSEDSIEIIDQICEPCVELVGEPDIFTCYTDSIFIATDFCYECIDCVLEWSTSEGVIISNTDSLNVWVGAPGFYTLLATDGNGFTNELMVEVLADTLAPVANAALDQVLNCRQDFATIGMDTMFSLNGHTYQWNSSNPAAIESPNLIQTNVSDVGTYYLTVVNTNNGCMGVDSVQVTYDTISPVADAGQDMMLSCDIQFVILDGSNSSLGNHIQYQWEHSGGAACITGETAIQPIVSCEGYYALIVTDTLNACVAYDTVFVNSSEDIPVIDTIIHGNINCVNDSILLSGNSPTPTGFSYEWCRIEDGMPVMGTCSDQLDYWASEGGDYRFRLINDATGCENERIVTVLVDTIPPVITAGQNDTLFCDLEEISLTGSVIFGQGPYDLLWYGEGGMWTGDYTPQVTEVGTYYFMVTDNFNGCTSIDSVEVVADRNVPFIDIGADTSLNCMNASILLSADINTTAGNYQMHWQDIAGNALADSTGLETLVNEEGIYIAIVTDTDNGCVSQDTVVVSLDASPPNIELVANQGLMLNCFQDTLAFTASLTTNPTGRAVGYHWYTLNNGHLIGDPFAQGILIDKAADYAVIGTDDINGCSDTLYFSIGTDITYPEIIIEEIPAFTCASDQVEIDATATDDHVVLDWYSLNADLLQSGGELLLTTQDSIRIQALDTANGCTANRFIFMTYDTISPYAIVAEAEPIDCANTETLLNGNGSSEGDVYSYEWQGGVQSGASSIQAIANHAGIYTLIVINEVNACRDSASVTVEQLGNPIISVNTEARGPDCFNEYSGYIRVLDQEGGTPPFIYTLDEENVSTTGWYEFLPEGWYVLELSDANGCTYSDSLLLESPIEVSVELGPDIELLLGDSITIAASVNPPTGNIDFTWLPKDLFDDPTAYEQTVAPTLATTYQVYVQDSLGCYDEDFITVHLIKERTFFVPSAFSPNGDGHNDLLSVFGGQDVEEVMEFYIFDRWGNLVYQNESITPNNTQIGWDGTLDGRKMNPQVFTWMAKVRFVDGLEEVFSGDLVLMR